MKRNNYCEYGHLTTGDVRLLPTGVHTNHGNVIICRKHYTAEMKFRHNIHWEGIAGFNAFPEWETLKIHNDYYCGGEKNENR